MQDDTLTRAAAEETGKFGAQGSDRKPDSNVPHYYLEVGTDLLSKPGALADLVMCEGSPATLIFCNSPSEADLAEVILKKRGVPAAKLIGNVPPQRVSEVLHQLRADKIRAIVLTDVAAREMDLSAFDLVVNYSIPEDPEVYLHRTPMGEPAAKLKKVYSLVSPLDFGNFHYLKKVIDFEIDKAPALSRDAIYEAEAKKLIVEATKTDYLADERNAHLTKLISNSDDKDRVIAFLVHTTLNATASAGQAAGTGEPEGGRDRGRSSRGGGDRGERSDRGDWGDRGGDRGERSDRGDWGDRGREGSRGGRRRDRGDDFRDNEPYQREHRGPSGPPKRDVRVYLGHGTADSFSEDVLKQLVDKYCSGLEGFQVNRFNLRNHYAFIDVPEACAEALLEGLKAATLPDGNQLFARRATVINVARGDDGQGMSTESAPAPLGGDDDDGDLPAAFAGGDDE